MATAKANTIAKKTETTKVEKTTEQIELEKAQRAAEKKEKAEKAKESAKAEKERALKAKAEAKEADDKAKAEAKAKKDEEKSKKDAEKAELKAKKEALAKEKADKLAEKLANSRTAKKAEKEAKEIIEKLQSEKENLLARAEEIRQFLVQAENEGGKLTTAVRCKGKQRISITLPLDAKVLLEAAIVDIELSASKIIIPTAEVVQLIKKEETKEVEKEEPSAEDIENVEDLVISPEDEEEDTANEDYAF